MGGVGRHPEPACVSSVCFTFGVLVLTRVVCVCESVAERLSTAWRQLDKDVAAAKRGASARMATAIDAAVSSVRVRFGRPDAVVAAAAPSSSSPSPPSSAPSFASSTSSPPGDSRSVSHPTTRTCESCLAIYLQLT